MPADFAATKKEVEWTPEQVKQVDWKMGGVGPYFIAAKGKVTMARLGKVGDEYVMQIAGGDMVEKPEKWNFEGMEFDPDVPACDSPDCQLAQIYLKLDGNLDSFVDSLRSNHMHVVYGDYVKELEVYCNCAGIKPYIV